MVQKRWFSMIRNEEMEYYHSRACNLNKRALPKKEIKEKAETPIKWGY